MVRVAFWQVLVAPRVSRNPECPVNYSVCYSWLCTHGPVSATIIYSTWQVGLKMIFIAYWCHSLWGTLFISILSFMNSCWYSQCLYSRFLLKWNMFLGYQLSSYYNPPHVQYIDLDFYMFKPDIFNTTRNIHYTTALPYQRELKWCWPHPSTMPT